MDRDNDSIVEAIDISLDQCDALLIVLTENYRIMQDNMGKFNIGAAQKYYQDLGYTIEQSVKMVNEHRALTKSVFSEIPGMLELLKEVRPILEERNKPKIIPTVPWTKKQS